MNRITAMASEFTKGPRYNMGLLLSYLTDPEIIPQPNKYYVFVYHAKTPNINYDQHPLVIVSDVYEWGFIGFNYHWNKVRRYTWQEVISNMYELSEEEFNTVQEIPIALFRQS
jgi:hypothetical protein